MRPFFAPYAGLTGACDINNVAAISVAACEDVQTMARWVLKPGQWMISCVGWAFCVALGTGVAAADDLAPEPPSTDAAASKALRPIADLLAELQAPDEAVRLAAVESLGKRRAHESVGALAAVIATDKSEKTREKAAYSLGLIGRAVSAAKRSEVAEVLSKASTLPSRDVRYMAVWALGHMKSGAGLSALAGALSNDGDAGVRARAAWAIGQLADLRGRENLFRALRDTSPQVRKEIVLALRALGVDDNTIRQRTPPDDVDTPLFGKPKSQTVGVLLAVAPLPGAGLIYAGKTALGIASLVASAGGVAMIAVGAAGGAFETEGFSSKNPGMKALFAVGVALAGISYVGGIVGTPLAVGSYNERIDEGRRAARERRGFDVALVPLGLGLGLRGSF